MTEYMNNWHYNVHSDWMKQLMENANKNKLVFVFFLYNFLKRYIFQANRRKNGQRPQDTSELLCRLSSGK